MYINPIEPVLLLICEDCDQFHYWNKIITEQNNGLTTICFGSKAFHQINATVLKNVSRQGFINGEYNNEMIDYHDLDIGGTAISIGVSNCVSSTAIELKFCQLLSDHNIQMWGVAPMRRNLIRALHQRACHQRWDF